jgi:hypothetical protein
MRAYPKLVRPHRLIRNRKTINSKQFPNVKTTNKNRYLRKSL